MKLPRFLGVVDLAVLISLAIALPIWSSPPPMVATDAIKGSDAERFEVALAEARVLADPQSGGKSAALAEQLGSSGHRDWAIAAAVTGAERAKQSPDRWRALSAASVAYVDRLDVRPALEQIELALGECDRHPEACPEWERVRMDLYRQNLDAGVRSGIDPRKDPVGFRRAGESGFRSVRLSPNRPRQ
jgi:hypothetical protein